MKGGAGLAILGMLVFFLVVVVPILVQHAHHTGK